MHVAVSPDICIYPDHYTKAEAWAIGWNGHAGTKTDAWLTASCAQVCAVAICTTYVQFSLVYFVAMILAGFLSNMLQNYASGQNDDDALCSANHSSESFLLTMHHTYSRHRVTDSSHASIHTSFATNAKHPKQWADCVLALLQIGQVMLALPSAVAKTGLYAGLPLMVIYGLISTWTIHNVTALYVDMKRAKVRFPF